MIFRVAMSLKAEVPIYPIGIFQIVHILLSGFNKLINHLSNLKIKPIALIQIITFFDTIFVTIF